MSQIETISPAFLVKPQISSMRLAGVLRNLQEKRSHLNPIQTLETVIHPEILQKIQKDKNYWISQEMEDRGIQTLMQLEDLTQDIFLVGREGFLTGMYDLLPADESQLSLIELLHKIPVFVNRFTNYVHLEVDISSESRAEFTFRYHPSNKEKWYDYIFFKGMLNALVIVFQLEEYKIDLLSTRLTAIPVNHSELGENIQFGASFNRFLFEWTGNNLRIGKGHPGETVVKPEKTFYLTRAEGEGNEEYKFLNVNSIVHRSRELAIENRDLEAAVEILKSFKTELEVKQKSMARDLKIARDIQQGIIPQSIPDWNGFEFQVKFRPMMEVSGDYYDYFLIGEDSLGVIVSDVSGHGVPAAFVTALSKLLFSKYQILSPTEIFSKANLELLELVKRNGYMTCFYLLLKGDNSVVYSSAGHPPPIHYHAKDGSVTLLEGTGTFLGMFPEAGEFYEDYTFFMDPGDRIYIYTDGIIEALNDQEELFGIERLQLAIQEHSTKSVNEAMDSILEEFLDFSKGTDQSDDQTLLVVSLHPKAAEYREIVQSALDATGKKDYRRSLELWEKAHSYLPDDLQTLFYFGKLLAKQSEFEKAAELLKKYNLSKTQNPDAHLILGFCYFQLGDYSKAEQELKRSLSVKQGNLPALHNLAQLYKATGQTEKAGPILERIRKLHPKSRSANQLNGN